MASSRSNFRWVWVAIFFAAFSGVSVLQSAEPAPSHAAARSLAPAAQPSTDGRGFALPPVTRIRAQLAPPPLLPLSPESFLEREARLLRTSEEIAALEARVATLRSSVIFLSAKFQITSTPPASSRPSAAIVAPAPTAAPASPPLRSGFFLSAATGQLSFGVALPFGASSFGTDRSLTQQLEQATLLDRRATELRATVMDLERVIFVLSAAYEILRNPIP